MTAKIENAGSQILIDVPPQNITILEAQKLIDTLEHCVKQANLFKNQNEEVKKQLEDWR